MNEIIELGEKVRIVYRKSPFYKQTGRIQKIVKGILNTNYCIQLEVSPISTFHRRDHFIRLEAQDSAMLENIYSRYVWMQLLTITEVLNLLSGASTLGAAQSMLCKYLHKNHKLASPSLDEFKSMLPDKHEKKLSELDQITRADKWRSRKKRLGL